MPTSRAGAWIFAALCVAMLPALAIADTQVSGTAQADAPGENGHAQFACSGMPTCTGTITIVDQCTNSFTLDTDIVVTGLDLSHPTTSLSGNVTIGADIGDIRNPDGSCTFQTRAGWTFPYSGSWNGSTGSVVIAHVGNDGTTPKPITVTFTASVAGAAPVFPMNVTGSVTPTTADAEATIQPRAQDAGTQQNVYVFTHAPSSLVAHASAKAVSGPAIPATRDDAVVCVLAQVTSDGHLVAATASSLQAALSGVLSSQGQSVQLLNNVPTPNVAGATVFVGYGTSAAAMLSSHVYEAAMSVPGAVQCTASLASAPAPTSPGALSGLWWNAAESGWGIHFTQRGSNLFAAWYTYDAAGNPKWYVAPNCRFADANATSGSCTSPLYEVNGPTFFGTAFNPSLVHATQDGTLTLNFQDAGTASLSYSLPGFSRTVAIARQVFPVAQTATPAVDYTDLWWNSDESGWGMAITHQFGNIFLAWYVYDANGKPFWYVAPACTVEGSSCSGTLYRTTGPAFGPPLDPTKVQATSVGSAIVSFVDANNAVLSYTVDGVSGTKAIKRQLF